MKRHRHRRGAGQGRHHRRVCALLAENNVNILDISQTILQGSFTMVMAVDAGASKVSIGELRELLSSWAKRWRSPSASSGRRNRYTYSRI